MWNQLAPLAQYGPMHGPGGWGGGWRFFPLGGAGLVIVIGLVILLVLLVVRRRTREGAGREGPRETPLDVLNKRYAAGEIDRETYLRAKKDLEEKP
jgi:putative membrane protein